jgi:hypothetical protein
MNHDIEKVPKALFRLEKVQFLEMPDMSSFFENSHPVGGTFYNSQWKILLELGQFFIFLEL